MDGTDNRFTTQSQIFQHCYESLCGESVETSGRFVAEQNRRIRQNLQGKNNVLKKMQHVKIVYNNIST